MKCPNCSKENQPDSQFCIFCGTRLTAPAPPPLADESTSQPAQTIEEEVRQLRESVRQINARLSALEQRQVIPQPPAVPAQAPAAPRWVPPPPQPKPPRPPREWEQILGGNWLARIGVLALLFGIGFFLKFAFDRNWIVPVVRVIIGVAAGLLMLGGGYLWRKRYPVLTQILTGGGIGVMYLSFFASFTAYDLIGFLPAVILIMVVCAASAVLALRYNSMGLAILGVVGAFIAPFVLGAFQSGRASIVGGGPGYEILGYTLIIDVGVLVVSTFRTWRWFTLLALASSLIIWAAWYSAFEWEATFAGAELFLCLIFLVFVAATTLFHVVWRRPSQPFDYALVLLNAAACSGISIGLFWGNAHAWAGAFTFGLSLFYAGLAYLTLRRAYDLRLTLFALGTAIVLFTVAAPVQFGEQAWAAVIWAAEAAALTWLAIRTGMVFFRWAGYAVFFITAFRLLIVDTGVTLATFTPVLNHRFLAFAVGIAAMYLAGYFIAKGRGRLLGTEARAAVPVFFIAASFFTLWLFTAEILNTFDKALLNRGEYYRVYGQGTVLRNLQNLSITALWAVYAIGALVVGILRRVRFLRLAALVLLLIAIGKVFVYDVFNLAMVYRIIAFTGLGLLLIAAGYLYQRYRTRIVTFLKE